NSHGLFLHEKGDYVQAFDCHQEGKTILQRLPADAEPVRTADLARACVNLGLARHAQGKPAEAEAAYREAIALFDRLTDLPTRPNYLYSFGAASLNLAILLQAERPRPPLPEAALVAAFDPFKFAALCHPEFPWRAILRKAEAREHLARAVESFERLQQL